MTKNSVRTGKTAASAAGRLLKKAKDTATKKVAASDLVNRLAKTNRKKK